MAGVDIPRDKPTVEYGCVLQVCVADDLFNLEVERAPDSGGSPDLGNIITLYDNLNVPPNDTKVIYDYVPDQNQIYHYRFRSVLANWTDGDWSDWYGVEPDIMPIEEGIATRTPCSSLGTRWMWVEYDIIEATDQAVFSWVGSDLVTEVEIWEDTTLDGEPDAIIANGDDLPRIGTYTVETVTAGYRKTFWFYSYFADGEILVQAVKVVRFTGGDPDNYGNVILNPDFEQGASYWKADAVGDAAIDITTPLAGAKSLNVITNGTSSAFVSQVSRASDDIDGVGTYLYQPVAAGETYRVIATGKVQAAAAPLKVDIQFWDNEKVATSIVTGITFTETGETRKSGYFTVPDNGSLWMTVQFRMDTDGASPRNGYVDDIYITSTSGIVPTVQEDITYDGAGNATLTLTMSDPEGRITQVEFNTKSGLGAWSGYAVDTAPYAATVALADKHDSHIAYKITYTAPDGSTGYIEAGLTLDRDIQPEMDTPWMSIDSNWNVWMSHAGDDDTKSVQYETDLTDQPTRGEVQTNGTAINSRQAKTQIHTGLLEDETLYVSVLAYSLTGGFSGGGTESVVMHELEVTRQTGFIAPTIQSQLGYDGSGNGTITLIINDPQGRVNQVRYDSWAGGAADWVGWAIDASAPWGPWSVALHEKHDSHIRWEVRYLDPGLGGVFIEGNATFDVDTIPELSSLDINFDDSGNATLAYHGDDDVGSIKWATSTSAFPSGATVDANTCPTWCHDDRSHGALPLQVGAIAVGETIFVSIYAFGAAGAGNPKNPFLYEIKRTRISGSDTILPTVQAQITSVGSNEITLVIDDPQSLVNLVGFKKYERGGTPDFKMEWGSWVDDTVGPPWDLTTTITRDDKHNSIIAWRVGFDYGGGTKYIENVIVFDLDTTPEINSVGLHVDDDGDVFLTYAGDDDCLSVKWKTSNSDFPDYTATTTTGTLHDYTSATNVSVGSLTAGQNMFISVAAYPEASAGGTAHTEMGWGRTYRPTIGLILPTVQAQISGSNNEAITLAINDPGGYVTGVGFRKYTNGSWAAWVDDLTVPYTLTTSITREEKHYAIIAWRVRYDLGQGDGNVYIENVIVYDPDTIPQINWVDVKIDDAGKAWLSYRGDDDCLSVKYATVTSSNPSANYPDYAATILGTLENNSAANNLDLGTPAVGETVFVSVAAYPEVSGGGTAHTKLGHGKATRLTNTAITVNPWGVVFNNGDVGLRWSGEGIQSIRYATGVNSEPSCPTGGTGGTFTTAKWIADLGSNLDTGDILYCCVVGYTSLVGTGSETDSMMIQLNKVTPEYTAPPNIITYDPSSPGEPEEAGATTGDVWYDTSSVPWTTFAFDDSNPIGAKWEAAQGTYSQVARDGFVAYTPRKTLRFISGTGVAISNQDDPTENETELTFAMSSTADADTVDGEHAAEFVHISGTETITGTKTFTKPILVEGASTGETVVKFNVPDLTFDRSMGFQFQNDVSPFFLHKSVIEGTSGDFEWHVWDSGWTPAFEIIRATQVTDFKAGPTVNGVALAIEGSLNADTLDTKDSTEFAILNVGSTFTQAQTINAASPVLFFQDTADVGGAQVGPAWLHSTGAGRWSWRFDGSDLSMYGHNGTPAASFKLDYGYNRMEFIQRPTEDGYGAGATPGVPSGYVIFSGDNADDLNDITYTTGPGSGQVLIWGGSAWEPGDVPAASLLSDVGDVSIGYADDDFLYRVSGAWIGQTAAQIGIPLLSAANTWTAAQKIDAANPVLYFQDSADTLGMNGPVWKNAAGTDRWSFRSNGTDLYLYGHNGTPAASWKMDYGYDRMEFFQRPTSDEYGAGSTPGVPTGYVIFSGDNADDLSDVNYASGLTGGDVLTWDAGNTWWEPQPPAAASLLSSIGDVNSGYANGDFLNYVTDHWQGNTRAELNLARTDGVNTFNGAQTIATADPRMIFRDTADGTVDDVGPFWEATAGGDRWSWRFNGTDLWMYNHNGTPSNCFKLDLSSNNVVFNQRPFWDASGIATAGDDLDYFNDVSYTPGLTADDVMTWSGSAWEPQPQSAPSHNLASHSDVSSSTASGDVLYKSGTTWLGQTISELGAVLNTDISVQDTAVHKGYLGPNDLNFINGTGTTWTVVDAGSAITVRCDVTAAGSSYGENNGDYQIGIDANGGGANFFRIRSGTYSGGTEILTLSEAGLLKIDGHLQAGASASGNQWQITSSGTLITFDNWGSGNPMRIGPSTADSLTLRSESSGSTSPTTSGVFVDDGAGNNAKVACIKNITATATAPTGDYPYGTLHLIY